MNKNITLQSLIQNFLSEKELQSILEEFDYKDTARWEIESFFRWIKQNLNVPVLFGTTKNTVFNQLFAALITYVLLKWIHVQTGTQVERKPLSLAGFVRQILCDTLPFEWRLAMNEILEWYVLIYNVGVV